VPVLARTLEVAGLSTVMVTNMPIWAEQVGVPRTLAVEFPFGHTLGQPRAVTQQKRVICQALEVLETAKTPGMIIHSQEKWHVPKEEALKSWQPEVPSPIIQVMVPRIREMLRQRKKKAEGFS
jgi:hypothetical protein